MTLPIGSIQGVAGTSPTAYLPDTEAAAGAPESVGSTFESFLGGSVDEVQALSDTSRQLSIDAVTGDLQDVHAATIASAQSSLALETITTFRNRGVEAFNEIMRMQA